MQFGRGYAQGAERYVRILAEGLRSSGHDACVLAGDPARRGPPVAFGEPIESDLPLFHYPSAGWMSIEGSPPRALVPALRELRPDVVHLANPGHVGVGIIAAACALGIPVVITVVDFWWLCPKHTLWKFRRETCDGTPGWTECLACISHDRPASLRRVVARVPGLRSVALPVLYLGKWAASGVRAAELARWPRRRRFVLEAMNRAHAVILASRVADELLRPRLTSPCIHTIPFGLEPRWFAAGAARDRRLEVGHSRSPTIGYAGALAPHKGPHVLIDALRRLGWRDTQVRIAGPVVDAAYAQELRRVADGLAIEFAGTIESQNMPDFLRGLDLLVVPSLWPENLPLIVLESLAVGTPVLASDVGGIVEAVPDPRFRFTPGSVEVLADRLQCWRSMGPPAELPRVSRSDEMIRRTLEVYSAVLNR